MMMLFVLVQFGHAVKCGEVQFVKGMKLEYETNGVKVHFTVHVPAVIYENYEWVGMGLKPVEKGTDMKDADIVSVIFKKNTLQDRWATENAYPLLDSDLGGNADYKPGPTKVTDDLVRVFSWARPYYTGDVLDYELVPNSQYYMLWAYGHTLHDDLAMHTEAGFTTFQFIECKYIDKNKPLDDQENNNDLHYFG